ncbi:hypothetical protein UA08_07800 [Talaromyces atroroseus]|uniref:Uncharacterized protein n=1 Tax=Talaromyces atroroseus TaxID=1441469 RepID=A0A225AA29_TALAT|nr:hypothetical protein UA08_07800 [Talaromyces atroroseus]OKL56960.1 hypothetical protein UA08_07800 [Talaromyces atroroseus]
MDEIESERDSEIETDSETENENVSEMETDIDGEAEAEEENCVSSEYMQALYKEYSIFKGVRCARDMWLNVLLRHFRSEENCGISFQCDFQNYVTAPERPVFVAHVVNMTEPSIEGATRVVIAMLEGGCECVDENTRPPFQESDMVVWKKFTDEVSEYLLKLRGRIVRQDGEEEVVVVRGKTLYAITIAGMLAKFYALEPDSECLMDCSGTNGEYFDVFEDISAIDMIAEEIALERQPPKA